MTLSRSAGVILALIMLAGCTSQSSTAAPGPSPAVSGPVTPAPRSSGAGSALSSLTSSSTVSSSTASSSTASSSTASSKTTTARPATSSVPVASTAGAAPGDTCASGHCYSIGHIHSLPMGAAPESSGIVASQKSPGVYFVVDDGTGTNRIVAVRANGSLVGNVQVQGMSTGNAEALSAGACGDRPGRCFYIGDIGDNGHRRDHITVYRIAEPSVSPVPSSPVAADAWDYTYPDGPHDAESMTVDAGGSLVVITKSAPDDTTGTVAPHRIYRGAPGGGRLRFVSSFTPPQPARRVQSLFTGNVVTDAAYTPGRMLLLTYDQVIEYLAPTTTADPATFPSWPHHELPDPPMIQTEGITADITGCGYQVTSEEGPGGTQAGLAAVTCR